VPVSAAKVFTEALLKSAYEKFLESGQIVSRVELQHIFFASGRGRILAKPVENVQ
jgi:hypothetical protein